MIQSGALPKIKAACGLADQPLATNMPVLCSWPFSRHLTPEKWCCVVSLHGGNVTGDISKSRTSFCKR